jgi:hypothetical protein
MTYKKFKNIILQLQKQDRKVSDLYKQKVDLMDFVDPYQIIIAELIKEIYGEEGYDWFSWYCYENNYGQQNLGAWDKNKNLICYDHKSLWEYLEKSSN